MERLMLPLRLLKDTNGTFDVAVETAKLDETSSRDTG